MMTSLAQNFQPGGIQQHPGVPQGHPMAVPHNPNQQLQGPGMPQQMHMGVSGPGPQVSQPGAMMGGMPPGVGGPSAHALQHLNPGQAQQAQMFQQQQQMFANNPQLQQQIQQQHQMIQQQRAAQARQQMLQQQYSGMPQGMQNGMNMTQAQFNAMRGGPMARPVNVNLPQHLQQQQQVAQQQAQHSMEQQAQAQAQHQHQQQLMAAQQMALQQQANAQAQAGGNNHGQPNPMNAQQIQNMQQAQMAAVQQAHQAQQQQQHVAGNPQSQPQPQAQPQPPPANPQAPTQQAQQQTQGQPPNLQTQSAVAMLQQRQGERGQCLLQLLAFADHLSNFGGSKQRDDLNYWLVFVDRFFSKTGVLRHSVYVMDEDTNKQYEITFPALARYFHTHFESGVKNMQMIMEKGQEKPLPNNQHYIESPKSSFVYWFDNGSQLIANGTLKAHFDSSQKIELLEFITTSHEEYLPRHKIIEAARPLHEWGKEWKQMNNPADGKASPEMNKKKSKVTKSPAQAPPEFDLPQSKVKHSMGITHSVFRFLEFVEVLGQMNPLFGYSHQNSNLAPYSALEQYVSTVVANGANNTGASPALGQLNLPGSPHVDGSPAQAPGMLPQHSQQTHSSGHSAQTSPMQTNKRRRPSAVKVEDDGIVNGTAPKTSNSVKASPRVGGKRQKGNPA